MTPQNLHYQALPSNHIPQEFLQNKKNPTLYEPKTMKFAVFGFTQRQVFFSVAGANPSAAAKELGEKLVGLVSWWQASTGKGDSCRGCELWFDRGATSGSAKIRQPKRERQQGGLGKSAVTLLGGWDFRTFSAMYSRPFGRDSHSPILRGRKRSPWLWTT